MENQIEELTKKILQLKEDNNSTLIGKELLNLKSLLKHGEYTSYIEDNLGFSIRSSQRYIKNYKDKYYTTNEKYLAYSMAFLGFQCSDNGNETYSFENTAGFKNALNNLLQLKQKITN